MKIDKLSSNGWFERLFSLCLGSFGHRRCPTTSDVSPSKKSLFYVINPNNEVNCPGELPGLFQIKNWTQSYSHPPLDFKISQSLVAME